MDYTWYEIEEDVWIASKEKEWTILHGEEIVETPEISNKNETNLNENVKDDEIVEEDKIKDYEDLKDENNPIFYFIDWLITIIKKIFTKKK